jgi:hypothetical protein
VRLGFVGAAVLYAFVAILLAASLPVRVPLGFGADLTADRWTGRGAFMLLVCGLGALVIGLFTGLAARHRRLRSVLQQLGAVTVAFLAVELALAYGGLGAHLASSSFATPGAEARYTESVLAGVPLSGWVVVVLAGYLAYLLAWLSWVVVRGQGHVPGPRPDPARGGTAHSPV